MNQSLTLNHEAAGVYRRADLAMSNVLSTRWIISVITILLIVTSIFLPQYPQILYYAGTMLPILIAAMIFPYLYKKGRIILGLRLLVVGMFFTVASMPLIMPESLMIMAACQGILYLFAFYLLDRRDAILATLVSMIVFAVLMYLVEMKSFHLFPPLDPIFVFIVMFFMCITIFAVTAFTILRFTSQQDALYHKQEEANHQLEQSAKQSHVGRERLEQMVQSCVTYMTEISRGNMKAVLSLDSQPGEPMQVLGENLEAMTETLRDMIVQMKSAVEDLNQAAAEILASTSQQASGASQQSTAITETTVTVEEVKTIAEHTMRGANDLAGLSQRSVDVSRSGKQSVSATVQSMQQIRSLVERIAENILSLSEKTQKIGEIITTVNDISMQSNILALNASVEAARAGEHGRGFSVVAVEMRALAEQSRQATNQVKSILSDIQQATNITVMVTEEGSKGADQGVLLADRTGQSIEGLAKAIEEAAQEAAQMAAGSRQQMSGIDQVSVAINSIKQATIQSLASTRQTERAAQDLNQLARSLAEMVARYQVN